MQFNRTKNSTLAFIFGFIYKAITIIGPFVTRTIIIYKLGTEYVGLSSLFTSVLSILNISELGVASAIAFCLYKPVADNDIDTVKALMSLLRKLYKYIGVFILALGLILVPFLSHLIKGEHPQDINITILYMIYLLNACASYLGFAYKGVLFNVYQRGDVKHRIEAVAEIIKYVLQIVALVISSNYYIFALMLPISTIIITVALQLKSKQYFPEITPEGTVSDEIKTTVKKKVMYLSAHSVAAKLTNSVDNIVISGAIGLTAIGLYGNYNYISTSVLGLLLVAYTALTPAIGNSLCSETKEKNKELFDGLSFLCFWIIAFCSASLFCLFQPFMILWVGKERLLSNAAVIMITVFFYSNASRQLLGSYVGAAGLWDKTLFRQILAAVINLALDLILVKPFGIEGIVFASFFTNAVIALPMDVYVTYKYILHENVMKGIVKTIECFIYTIIICVITYIPCYFLKDNSILSFLLRVLFCLVIPNAIVLLFSFRGKGFLFVKNHVINLIKK